MMSFLSISLCLKRSICKRECVEAARRRSSAAEGGGWLGGGGAGCAGAGTDGARGGGRCGGGDSWRTVRDRLRGLLSTHSSSSSWRDVTRRRGGGDGDCATTATARASRSGCSRTSGRICFSWYRCNWSNFSSISGFRFSCFKALFIAEN